MSVQEKKRNNRSKEEIKEKVRDMRKRKRKRGKAKKKGQSKKVWKMFEGGSRVGEESVTELYGEKE